MGNEAGRVGEEWVRRGRGCSFKTGNPMSPQTSFMSCTVKKYQLPEFNEKNESSKKKKKKDKIL